MVMSADKDVEVRLSTSEALVLFEWLTSLDDPDRSDETPFSALEVVLIHLQGQIETQLPALFAPDYNEILERAPSEVLAGAYSEEALSDALAATLPPLCERCRGTGRESAAF